MESHSPELPLKICRHCSVATRTDAPTCPSCGRSYERRLWQWRWWFAIPIVVIAFGIGYFGISKLVNDDDSGGISAEEASAVTPESSPADVEDQLGEPPQYQRKQRQGEGALSCSYYGLSDEPNAVWEFCFHDDKLVSSQQLGGPQGEGTSAPPPQQ
jgi:hypothetical protein